MRRNCDYNFISISLAPFPSMSGLFEKFDNFTWNYVPLPFKSVIERTSWWKLVLIYSTLIFVLIYRLFVSRQSIFFHSSSPLTKSSGDWREVGVQLVFFFFPMFLAFTTQRRQVVT